MTGGQIIFLLVALFTLGSGFMVVTTGNLVHAALWLVATLFGVAVTYALLSAAFLAVVQVVVYIGAIAICLSSPSCSPVRICATRVRK
jgi:NADH-quinone oxidoreductase subunit J